jgi:hypothetical protein
MAFPFSAEGAISVQLASPRVPTREEVIAAIATSLRDAHADVYATPDGLSFTYDSFRLSWRRSPLRAIEGGEVVVHVSDRAVSIHFELSDRIIFIGSMVVCGGLALAFLVQGALWSVPLVLLLPLALVAMNIPSKVRRFRTFLQRVIAALDGGAA